MCMKNSKMDNRGDAQHTGRIGNVEFIEMIKRNAIEIYTVACFLVPALFLKYQTLVLTSDKEHCSSQVGPGVAGTGCS